jgi:hypothetical protein
MFRDFKYCADALQVKRPHKEASPFMVEIAWRIDAIAALLNRKGN